MSILASLPQVDQPDRHKGGYGEQDFGLRISRSHADGARRVLVFLNLAAGGPLQPVFHF